LLLVLQHLSDHVGIVDEDDALTEHANPRNSSAARPRGPGMADGAIVAPYRDECCRIASETRPNDAPPRQWS
jgi:hypothetical protein